METLELKQKANEIRRLILEMVYQAKSGHLGGSLSAADIFTCLYGQILRIDPQNPKWKFRDRFVLSKGHATPAYYASLAEFGFFPKDELRTFRRLGSRLRQRDRRCGHCGTYQGDFQDFGGGILPEKSWMKKIKKFFKIPGKGLILFPGIAYHPNKAE